jgi:hypothetical protein
MVRQVEALEAELAACFESHPDAEILHSLPGLGAVLGARVLGDRRRSHPLQGRPIAEELRSDLADHECVGGNKRVITARLVRNRFLADACHQRAFCSLSTSGGVRAFCDEHRARNETHDKALRVLANRLVGILDGCLRSRTRYDEQRG